MASIKKDKNGKWYFRISYKDSDGKYKQKTKKGFSTKKEAQYQANIATSDPINYEIKNKTDYISFSDYFETWVTTYKLGRFSASTENKYLAEIKRVRNFFGNKNIKSITRSEYQSYLNKRGSGNGKDVVEKTHIRLSSCFKDAMYEGLIDKDPTYKAVIKFDNKSQEKIKVHSEKECQALIASLSSEINEQNMMLYIALMTGMRIGEVFGLSWDDISDESIRIERGYDYVIMHNFTALKNKHSIRTIAINSGLSTRIKQYKIKFSKKHPTHMFIDAFGKESISHRGLMNYYQKKCLELDIQTLNIHALRHTHCSTLIFKGMNIQYISKRLGHKDATETLKTYAHIFDEFNQMENQKIIGVLEEISEVQN